MSPKSLKKKKKATLEGASNVPELGASHTELVIKGAGGLAGLCARLQHAQDR